MEFIIKSNFPAKQVNDCGIFGIYENNQLPLASQQLNTTLKGTLNKLLKLGDMTGKLGSTLLLHSTPYSYYKRILLVGLGKKSGLSGLAYRKILKSAAETLCKTQALNAVNHLIELPVKNSDTADKVEQAIQIFEDQWYQFEQFKKDEDKKPYVLEKILLIVSPKKIENAQQGLSRGHAIANAVTLTKNLGNLPANICTPSYLADCAKTVARKVGASIDILNEKDLDKLNMAAFLSVAKGSVEPPRFIILTYENAPSKKTPPVVLVGKGITFDSGGISLKHALNMENMKYDMCGAAAVLGTFQAVADMRLPLNLIALIPTCENLPSGKASKPGDIVTTMSGLTVEIINTDAEGRLILCDALHYAKRFKPQLIIDVATLTGACLNTFGNITSGLFANRRQLAKKLLDASEQSGDAAWELPLWNEYNAQIKSQFADLANVGGPTAGSITAALFLSHFTPEYPWAHLDIAGTAYEKNKGATGRPVPLLTKFLSQYALKPTYLDQPLKATKDPGKKNAAG